MRYVRLGNAERALTTRSLILRQVVINSSVNIVDSPRFRHRGVMLDSARHFLPVSIIKKNLVGFVDPPTSITFRSLCLSRRSPLGCHVLQ